MKHDEWSTPMHEFYGPATITDIIGMKLILPKNAKILRSGRKACLDLEYIDPLTNEPKKLPVVLSFTARNMKRASLEFPTLGALLHPDFIRIGMDF